MDVVGSIASRIRSANLVFSITWFVTILICMFWKVKNPFKNVVRYLACISGLLISIAHFILVTRFSINIDSDIYTKFIISGGAVTILAVILSIPNVRQIKKSRTSNPDPPGLKI